MINTNKILQLAGNAKSKLFDNLIRALVKATYLFGFTYKQFVESYEKGLVAEGKNRGLSIVEISSRTGIDRRRVSTMIKLDSNHKQHQSLRFNILLKLYEHQQNINKGNPISIKDFNRIVRENRDGNVITSPEQFLKLICSESIGCAVIIDQDIDIISPCLNKITDLDTVLEIYSDNSNRLINTITYNVKSSDHKLFERMTKTTQIPTEKHNLVIKELNKILLSSFKQVKKIIFKYEINVKRDTYPEIGVHLFQFAHQNRVNQNNSNNKRIVNFNNT
jgi:hypothetical protein